MKQLSLLSLICSSMFLFSCKKEMPSPTGINPENASLKDTGVEECITDIDRDCNGILVFLDQEHYEQVYSCLEQIHENYNIEFETANEDLSEDDYELLIDNSGFDEDLPLQEFEAALGHNSYRALMAGLMEDWEVNWGDGADHPDSYNIIDDLITETLFSEEAMVIIGGFLIYITPDGDMYEIPFEPCGDISEIINNPPEEYKSNHNSGPLCDSRQENFGWLYYEDDNRVLVWKMRFQQYWWSTKSKAKMKTYKVKNNGGWKKHRTRIAVRNWGRYLDVNCNSDLDFDVRNPDYGVQPTTRRTWSLKVKKKWDNDKKNFASGQIHGAFIKVYPNGTSYVQVLEDLIVP